MLLRNRFLGGIWQGALFAGPGETASAPPVPAAPASSESGAASLSLPAIVAAPDAPAASASAAGADLIVAPAAPDPAAAAATADSPGSLLGDAKAIVPGAKPEAAAAAKPGDAKPAEPPAPAAAAADAKPEPAKAEAAKPAAEAAPAPAKTEALAEVPPARTYEDFKLPDSVKLDPERVKSFTTILDNAELSHQDRGQQLVDLFVSEMQNVQKARDQHQIAVFNEMQNAWKEDLRNDPDLGGNRIETSLGQAKWVIEQWGGTKEQQQQLVAQLSYTGMGNNVGMVRLLNNIAEILGEGEVVPASPIAPKPSGRSNWYPSMNGSGAPA